MPPGGVLNTDNLPSWWDTAKRQEVESFKAQCYSLSGIIMSCLAKCMGLDSDYFKSIHQHKEPGDTLKMIKYFRMKERPDSSIPRLAEHTDWGSITFVFTKTPGLEIRDPNNQWFHVPIVLDGIVVNIGDAMALWTGGALKSVLHRVTWDSVPIGRDRYTIGYFINPNSGNMAA